MVGDSWVRFDYNKWNYILLFVDYLFWDMYYLLNGYNCCCKVVLFNKCDIVCMGLLIIKLEFVNKFM